MNELKFIYGVPGSGKTFISKEMQTKLGWSLFEADSLRKIAQENATKEDEPFTFLGTCQAYRKFGELNDGNAIKGLIAVRKKLAPFVLKKVNQIDKTIIEAAFLDPSQLSGLGECLLVVTANEKRHQQHFFEHRVNNQETQEEFRTARIIQDFLIKEAKNKFIKILENN